MSLPTSVAAQVPIITADMARELALAQRVCIRPLLRRVEDRLAATEDFVAIPCGCTREAVCPPCAQKARVLRMQQCTEGWHRTDEPEREPASRNQASDASAGDEDTAAGEFDAPDRRVRSTRRRRDAPDLPPGPGRGPNHGPGVRDRRRQGVPAIDVPHPHHAVLRAGHSDGRSGQP